MYTYHFLCWLTILDMRYVVIDKDQSIMLLFLPIFYAKVLLKFTYYAQEQLQGLLSDYIIYAIHIQFCMNNSQHVADNFYKDCFIRVY